MFLAPENAIPGHLAYVEWFSSPFTTRDSNHGMYRVSRLMRTDRWGRWRQASVIPVEEIVSSIHLFPRIGHNDLQGLNSFTVLEKCNSFYVNPFSDVDTYLRFS